MLWVPRMDETVEHKCLKEKCLVWYTLVYTPGWHHATVPHWVMTVKPRYGPAKVWVTIAWAIGCQDGMEHQHRYTKDWGGSQEAV